MALWHFLKNNVGFSWEENGSVVSSFDDGLILVPGDDGFSKDAANTKAASLGEDIVAEYTGTPNVQEAEVSE